MYQLSIYLLLLFFIVCVRFISQYLIFTLAASSGKRNVTVWHSSICPSVCPVTVTHREAACDAVDAAPSPGWGPRGQGPSKTRQGPGKNNWTDHVPPGFQVKNFDILGNFWY